LGYSLVIPMSHPIVEYNSQGLNYQQIYTLLAARLTPESLQWLTHTIQQSQEAYSDRFFLTAFSLLPRQLVQETMQTSVTNDGPDWLPQYWSLETLGRSLLLLSQTPDRLESLFAGLYSTGSVNEQVALLQALPFLQESERYLYWAQEGFRSHITAVFNAIALNNPYPTRYFDSTLWNQLILKAIFIGSPLQLIQGLDDRANATLARMAIDYVHERWAAGRDVTPEIWRLIYPFVEVSDRQDLVRALQMPNLLQQLSVALLCSRSDLPEISNLMTHYPDLKQQIESGLITWEYIYQQQFHSLIDPLADGNTSGI
jgi:hypothetical protein